MSLISGFLMFPGGIERDQWHKMVLHLVTGVPLGSNQWPSPRLILLIGHSFTKFDGLFPSECSINSLSILPVFRHIKIFIVQNVYKSKIIFKSYVNPSIIISWYLRYFNMGFVTAHDILMLQLFLLRKYEAYITTLSFSKEEIFPDLFSFQLRNILKWYF